MSPLDPDAQRALRTEELRALGVGRGELDGPRWRTPYRGVHTPALVEPGCSTQRIYDAAELLVPGAAVGGWAAAHLLGAVALDGLGPDGRHEEPVVLLTPTRQHPCPRPGVRVFRSRLGPDDVCDVDGIPVTSPLRTAFDLARATTVERGLVAVDAFARAARLDLVSLDRYVRRHPRYRGVPVARSVVELCDPRARSAGESRLRFVWLVEAGLPRPEVNPLVVNAVGAVVAMTDLLDTGAGLGGEYDGSTHRELDEHTSDNAREEELEALGLVIVRATSLDVGPKRPGLVRRLRAGHERALATPGGSWGWSPGRMP
jgi:hypothetical protein